MNAETPLHPRLQEIEAHAEKLGYTIHGLLTEARVPASYWSNWKRGRHLPTTKTLDRIFAVREGPANRLKET